MAEVINKEMRKSIKIMAAVAQTAKFVSIMPQPKDFAVRITADIVYLSERISELSEKIGSVLDGYANIPTDYLQTQLNSMVSSATDVLNNVETYSKYMVDNVYGLGANATKVAGEVVYTSVNIYTATAGAAISASGAIKSTKANIKGDKETADEIKNSVNDSVSKLNEKPDEAAKGLRDAAQRIEEKQAKLNGIISDKSNDLKQGVLDAGSNLQKIIDKIKKATNNLSDSIDKNFGSLGTNQAKDISEKLSGLSNMKDGEDVYGDMATEAVGALAGATNSVLSNFTLGGCVKAFAGVAASAALIKSGLSSLPPINFNMMLANCVSDDYDDSNYNNFKESMEPELQEQRNSIKAALAERKRLRNLNKNNIPTKEERKSAIKELKKQREAAANAKEAKKYKDILNDELDRLIEDCNVFSNQISYEWNSMYDQYKNSVKEIRKFFTEGGGDREIEEICKDINQNCDDIKKLCTQDLPTQIVSSGVNVALPRAVGLACPNFAQHVVEFILDCKTIIKFIMDLLRYVMNIISDINKLVAIILNGINSFNEIFNQIMQLVGLSWLMKLIENIISLFKKNSLSGIELIENSLSPVYFSDTDYYDSMYNTIQDYLDNISNDTNSNSKLDISEYLDKSATVKSLFKDKTNDPDELLNALEQCADLIVAYRSPLFRRDNDGVPVPDQICAWRYFRPDLEHYNTDLFAYGTIDTPQSANRNANLRARIKRSKASLIYNAAKRSGKKKGGLAMISRQKTLFSYHSGGKIGTKDYYNGTFSSNHKNATKVTQWDAFYWYTVYTDDLINVDYYGDTFGNNGESTIKSRVTVTSSSQNGSLVTVTKADGTTQKIFVKDAQVKSGDTINVNGVKYKVN